MGSADSIPSAAPAATALAIALATSLVTAHDLAPPDASSKEAHTVEATESAAYVSRPDDELLILQLLLGPQVLTDGLFTYATGTGILVPLGELCAALSLPIEVDPAGRVAEGWLLTEGRRLRLDAAGGTVTVEGRSARFDPSRIEVHRTDIYVETTLLETWLPLSLDIDIASLRITVRPTEPFPIEQQLERRRRWERLHRPDPIDAAPPPPPQRQRLLGWPAVDTSVRASHHSASSSADRSADRWSLQHDTLMSGDLLGMTGQLAIRGQMVGTPAGSSELSSTIRLSLARADPAGRLLGRLHATRLALGDLLSPEHALISRSTETRGIEVTNQPLEQPTELDRISLSGPVSAGWEVELYRNDELVDYQIVDAAARYHFREVALLYGLNLLRVVMYGPHGERREALHRYMIGPHLVRHGESRYRLGYYTGGDSASGPAVSDTTDRVVHRLLASLDHGLARGLSIRAALDSVEHSDGRHTYGAFGLRTSIAGVFGQLDLVADHRGDLAGRLLAHTRIRAVDLRAEHEQIAGLTSQTLSGGDDGLRSRSICRLHARLKGAGGTGLLIRGEADLSRWSSSAEQLRLAGTAAHRWRYLALAESLVVTRSTSAEAVSALQSAASLRLSRDGPSSSVRGTITFRLTPDPDLAELALSADWDLGTRRMLRVDARRSFGQDQRSSVGGSVIWRLRHASLGASIRSVDNDRIMVGLNQATSLVHDPLTRRWRAGPDPSATTAAVAARVFLDHDLDGAFDAAVDQPLAGVRFRALGPASAQATGADGQVLLTGLPVHRTFELALRLATLEDPYWIPVQPTTRLTLTPGQVVALEVPIVVTGEVEGTVTLNGAEGARPVARVRVQALEPDGTVVAETETAFDGLYVLERIPPGEYTIRIEPEQLMRFNLAALRNRTITLRTGGEIIRQVDLELEPHAPET